MKIGVVVFPGSNCDADLINALNSFEGVNAVSLWHNSADLQECKMIMIPGGFSYGDYLRAGSLARHSKIMTEIISFVLKGNPVIGICNGFQILCESELLPGSLVKNKSGKFICDKIHLKAVSDKKPLNKIGQNKIFEMCIAHSEGNYYAEKNIIQDLIENDQILFKYCNSEGVINEESNPNGSIENIAGICNKERNVIALMPHPERAMDKELHGSDDGKRLLSLLIENFR